MDEDVKCGKKLPKTPIKEWNKWNCMQAGLTLAVLLLPNDETSQLIDAKIAGTLGHLCGRDIRIVAHECAGHEVISKGLRCSMPSVVLLQDGIILSEWRWPIDIESIVGAIVQRS